MALHGSFHLPKDDISPVVNNNVHVSGLEIMCVELLLSKNVLIRMVTTALANFKLCNLILRAAFLLSGKLTAVLDDTKTSVTVPLCVQSVSIRFAFSITRDCKIFCNTTEQGCHSEYSKFSLFIGGCNF